ncbi:MAG: hypothetical protein DF168_00903 [Candidatus Moanabacter tarae]|mgnify:CR=1 FL=1|uniref:Peptidase S55 domain-containing protein n=1 Tax=Candidatus Moanibacter tarae TaxID=2200854 RepID=A0A2Z4ACA1_9BACT|nr:MAG: hypothetical protein DF168_00903 [Candidatus Moanabacter tarae]|tara:strand:+ start:1273 stop:3075 length:1803 start_codon:yes stop_codon:yes gene_type:complete
MTRIFVQLWFLIALSPLELTQVTAQDLMPLSDVVTGIKGEWRTVVSGTEVESFELEVLGVAQNFVGPQRSVIICQALDPMNKLTGPVAGMSGSPVYIDKKLVGAYAYGYLWSRDQAIIGVTPIEQMLEVLEGFPRSRTRAYPIAEKTNLNEEFVYLSEKKDEMKWQIVRGADRIQEEKINVLLQPLPTPLMASGFSDRVLSTFKSEFDKAGITVMQAPIGSVSEETYLPMEPGSSVAAVLMNGDFNVSATGTVTYRNGDTILAFGHPFFQMGPTQLPMAGAEIITVVQSIPGAFKLAKTGPVIGAIYQDRLTAVAGLIGEFPPLLKMEVEINFSGGMKRGFKGELAEHPVLSPLFASVSLLQALLETLEASERQTFFLQGIIGFADSDPIEFSKVASGPDGAISVAFNFLKRFESLMNNPFKIPQVKSIKFDIDVKDTWLISSLKSVVVQSTRVKPGDNLELLITLYNYQEEDSQHGLSIPMPYLLNSGDQVTVVIADAEEAERIDGIGSKAFSSYNDIVGQWVESRSGKSIYIKLLRNAEGLRFEGSSMFDLPPSINALYASPSNNIVRKTLNEVTLWEDQIQLPGEYRGSYRIPLTLE